MRLILIAFATLLSCPAMAVDLNAALMDENGAPAKVCLDFETATKCKDGREIAVTLGLAVRKALNTPLQEEQNLPNIGDIRFHRGDIAQSMVGATEIALKAEDVADIKKLVGKVYPPVIVFQIWSLLDPPKK